MKRTSPDEIVSVERTPVSLAPGSSPFLCDPASFSFPLLRFRNRFGRTGRLLSGVETDDGVGVPSFEASGSSTGSASFFTVASNFPRFT